MLVPDLVTKDWMEQEYAEDVQNAVRELNLPVEKVVYITTAVAAGADGLLIEVHNDPDHALCDGPQSLLPEQFVNLVHQLRLIAEAIDRKID